MTADGLLVRSYPTELTPDQDGRTLFGRLVPYDQVATVGPDGWSPEPYDEAFARGAFRRATRSPQRVYLRVEHQPGVWGVAGYGAQLEERDDGLHGAFRTLETAPGPQALELHRAGVLAYFSVGFMPLGRGRKRGGVTIRTHCHLDEVSLCREPAYVGTEAMVRAATLPEIAPREPWAFEDRLAAVLASESR